MKTLCAALVLALSALGCAAERPASSWPAELQPRFGDPSRPTVWSQTQPENRLPLIDASRRESERGWALALQGELDAAAGRLNRAWSLDPRNARALWGLANVEFERARRLSGDPQERPTTMRLLDSAVSLSDEAIAVSPEPPNPDLLADAAYMRATRGSLRQTPQARQDDFARAEALLKRAEAVGPTPQVSAARASLERYRLARGAGRD